MMDFWIREHRLHRAGRSPARPERSELCKYVCGNTDRRNRGWFFRRGCSALGRTCSDSLKGATCIRRSMVLNLRSWPCCWESFLGSTNSGAAFGPHEDPRKWCATANHVNRRSDPHDMGNRDRACRSDPSVGSGHGLNMMSRISRMGSDSRDR
jgi:hypothetical protein